MSDLGKVLFEPIRPKYSVWRQWWRVGKATIFGVMMLGFGIAMRVRTLNNDPRQYPRPEFVQKMNEQTMAFSMGLMVTGILVLIVTLAWAMILRRGSREEEGVPPRSQDMKFS